MTDHSHIPIPQTQNQTHGQQVTALATSCTKSIQYDSDTDLNNQDWTQEHSSNTQYSRQICQPGTSTAHAYVDTYDSGCVSRVEVTSPTTEINLLPSNSRRNNHASGSSSSNLNTPLKQKQPIQTSTPKASNNNNSHQTSTPIASKTAQTKTTTNTTTNNNNTNTNKKSSKNKNRNRNKSKTRKRGGLRTPSESIRNVQHQESSDEDAVETPQKDEEYQLFIKFPNARLPQLIGKQGNHIKRYSEKMGVDLTIIPGYAWEKTPLKHDPNSDEVLESVIRFESYRSEDIVQVLVDINGRFLKISYEEIAYDSEEDSADEHYFAQFYHNNTFYAGSEFLHTKASSKSPERSSGESKSKYNMPHSKVPSSSDRWTTHQEQQDWRHFDEIMEHERIEKLTDEFHNAMVDKNTWHLDGESASKSNSSKKRKGKKNKKPFGSYSNAYASYLPLDKRRETMINITSVFDSKRIIIQQPTHPSFLALSVLEVNIFNFYSPNGNDFREDSLPAPIKRDTKIGTYCTCADPWHHDSKFLRAKVESINDEEDMVTVFFLDYGGFYEYHRNEVYPIMNKFLKLPFQSTIVELVNLYEEDERCFSKETENNSKISNSQGEATQTDSPTHTTSDSHTQSDHSSRASSHQPSEAEDCESKQRSSTFVNADQKSSPLPPPCFPPKPQQKIKYNIHCPKTVDPDVPCEVYYNHEINQLYGQLLCEVVKEVEDFDTNEIVQHVRLFRYNYLENSTEKTYIDYRAQDRVEVSCPEQPINGAMHDESLYSIDQLAQLDTHNLEQIALALENSLNISVAASQEGSKNTSGLNVDAAVFVPKF